MKKLPELKSLVLVGWWPIDDETATEFFMSVPQLEEVDISSCDKMNDNSLVSSQSSGIVLDDVLYFKASKKHRI